MIASVSLSMFWVFIRTRGHNQRRLPTKTDIKYGGFLGPNKISRQVSKYACFAVSSRDRTGSKFGTTISIQSVW